MVIEKIKQAAKIKLEEYKAERKKVAEYKAEAKEIEKKEFLKEKRRLIVAGAKKKARERAKGFSFKSFGMGIKSSSKSKGISNGMLGLNLLNGDNGMKKKKKVNGFLKPGDLF